MSPARLTAQSTGSLPQWSFLSARRRTREILAHSKASDTVSRVFDTFIVGLILLNVLAMLGIGMFALPTGILGAGFVEELDARKNNRHCPHCGKEITS